VVNCNRKIDNSRRSSSSLRSRCGHCSDTRDLPKVHGRAVEAGIIPVVSDLWTIEKYVLIAREIGKPIAPLACESTTVAELLSIEPA